MKKFVINWYVTIIPVVVILALSLFIVYLIMREDVGLGLW